MPDYKSVLKNGWNPTWDKTKIDRTNYKNPRAWVQKDDSSTRAQSHQFTPLSSLRDPASFAPPPKHTRYYSDDGSPLPATGVAAAVAAAESEEARAVSTKAKPSPTPFRADTTNLRVDHLPAPPVRHVTGGTATAVSSAVPSSTSSASTIPKPSLPPRLPPRQNSNPNTFTPAPPPPYSSSNKVVYSSSKPALTTSSAASSLSTLNHLAEAGISVPDLGINRPANDQRNTGGVRGAGGAAASAAAGAVAAPQSRFGKTFPATGAKPAALKQGRPPIAPVPHALRSIAAPLTAASPSPPPHMTPTPPPVPPPVPRASKPGMKKFGGSSMHPGIGMMATTDAGFDGGGGGGGG